MNNNRLLILVKGELERLHKYNFTFISVLVAIIWGAVLYFLEDDAFATILPFVLMLDATMMAIMYVGSVMYFEKNESTISTLIVTPITNSELILSKTIAYTLHNLLGSILIILAFVFIREVQINYFIMIGGIMLATAFHTIVGISLSYFQKDFTGMLVQIMVLAFILFIPSVLVQLSILEGAFWDYLLLINPIDAATVIISAGLTELVEIDWTYYFSLAYLLLGGIILFRFHTLPKFQDYAVKQSGV